MNQFIHKLNKHQLCTLETEFYPSVVIGYARLVARINNRHFAELDVLPNIK